MNILTKPTSPQRGGNRDIDAARRVLRAEIEGLEALAKALDTYGAKHPGLETTKFTHEGVDVSVTRSKDGKVRRHRATVDGLELVSQGAVVFEPVLNLFRRGLELFLGLLGFGNSVINPLILWRRHIIRRYEYCR